MKETKPAVALLKNELFIREDIRIDDLHNLFPEQIKPMTKACYRVADGITINGHHHIILKTDYRQYNPVFEAWQDIKDAYSSLHPYICVEFIGQGSSENVWIQQCTEDGKATWMYEWVLFDDIFQYQRPLLFNNLDIYPRIGFMKMYDVPVRHFKRKPFWINVPQEGTNYSYPVPIL